MGKDLKLPKDMARKTKRQINKEITAEILRERPPGQELSVEQLILLIRSRPKRARQAWSPGVSFTEFLSAYDDPGNRTNMELAAALHVSTKTVSILLREANLMPKGWKHVATKRRD